jgi:hydrogenase expression/formation protein HypC
MCLAIPGKILDAQELDGVRLGKVQFGNIIRQTFLGFVPEAQPGDYVLVHVGFAISRIDEQEAARALDELEIIGLQECTKPE